MTLFIETGMIKNTVYTGIKIFFMVSLLSGISHAAGEEIIATGSDGFKVTSEDVSKVIKFVKKINFESSEEEYKKAAVKVKLFAREAARLGLISEKDQNIKYDENDIDTLMKLQALYVDHVLDTHPVSELAIKSFYFTYPEYFLDMENFDPDRQEKPELMALNGKVKEYIHFRITEVKKAEIMQKRYEELKQQHNIRFAHEHTGVD